AAGLRILHEPMYGASQGYVRALLSGGKTTVEEIHQERNPGFGGMHPEPIAHYMPEAMERMRAGGFDLCIANDGDADRVGIIDERGTFINQLQVMALLMMYLIEKRGQKGDVVRSLTSSGRSTRPVAPSSTAGWNRRRPPTLPAAALCAPARTMASSTTWRMAAGSWSVSAAPNR